MSRSPILKEELELNEILATENQLRERERAYAEIPKKIAQEIKERESTMPPLPEILERAARIRHEQTVSRGEVSNILRDQSRSTMLLLLLIAATSALIWWGMKLMQG